MDVKLFDSELKVMNVVWREGECPAKLVAAELRERYGWNVNTTYTLLKRCAAKGALERVEPGFVCRPLVPKEQVQEAETKELIDKVYDGSKTGLFAALLGKKRLTQEQLDKLYELVEDWE